MNSFRPIFKEMVLPFVIAWLFMTLFVDIIVIPNVFRNSASGIEAGKIGMAIFSKFNAIEITFSLFILFGVMAYGRVSKFWIGISLVLLSFAFFYTFYMTPMISNINTIMGQLVANEPQHIELIRQHKTYHTLYRSLDTIKMVVLFIFAGLLLKNKIIENQKENA